MSLRIVSHYVLPALIACWIIGTTPSKAAAAPPVQQPAGGPAPQPTTAPATQAATEEDDEAVLNPVEPDFVVVNLPTTLRLPLHKGNFRLNHRFAGNLRAGSFGENASNLFGLDQGAVIGFEYRFAVARHVEAAAYRSSFDKTIQLYGKYDALHQHGSMPFSLSAVGSVEGADNFQEKYAPAFGVTVSRTLFDHVAMYAVPMWVHNSAASLDAASHSEETHDTSYMGLGGRLLVIPTVTIVGEIIPRMSGYRPDEQAYGFGIEKRVGGHVFSLTFTNTFATTFAQLARGGAANTLYLGFNLSRKFY
jgi:hypothetical protein